MRASATLRLPDDTLVEVVHGDLIGRMGAAAVHIDDARVSEAHAMVSLRGAELKLLGLRGRFAINGVPRTDVVLTPGLQVALASDLVLTVEAVQLPLHVLAIEAPVLPRQVLTHTCSVLVRPRLSVLPGVRDGAAATIWFRGDAWRARVGDHVVTLVDGAKLGVGEIAILAVPLGSAGQDNTRSVGGITERLRIVTHYDTVHIHRGRDVVSVSGLAARILSELIACGEPVSWYAIATEIWSAAEDKHSLRSRWDVHLARLRRKLRDGRVRPDLVRADGKGNFQVLLYADDIIVGEM